jgi:two-component system sensor kinase FixL
VSNYAGALGRVLAGTNADPDRARDILERIRQQTLRAGEVIRRLREHVAKRATTRQPEDVNLMVREAVELGLVGTRHRGVRTIMQLGSALPPVMLDRIQIGQVIVNLVRNAVEAMEASAVRELTITTAEALNKVEISVADTGPGIAPEIAARLFQPFITSKAAGLGLGLSICRELVEAHDGQLSVSRRQTGGTIFVVTLPA